MNKGFSLVELIVVIAIMAILVGVAVPVYTSYISSANNKVDAQLVGEIDHAIEVLLIDNDVKNPATNFTITLGADGKYAHNVTGEAKDVADAFVAKLTEIVSPAALKGDADADKVVTFTINKYSVDNNYAKADPTPGV